MQAMNSKSQNRKDEGDEVTANLVTLGDLIWVRLPGDLWWPAQVVDDNTVSESIRPGKRSAREFLVRLYGSYEYLYADPIASRSEFEMILKQNDDSYKKIFQQSLYRDLPHMKSGRLKGQGSTSKGNVRTDACRDKKSNQSRVDDQEVEFLNFTSDAFRDSLAASVRVTKALKGKAKSSVKSSEGNISEKKGIEYSAKQDGSQRKSRQNNAIEEAKGKMSKGKYIPNAKSKKRKQDEVQKNIVQEKKSRESKQVDMKKKVKQLKPYSTSTEDDGQDRTPEQNKATHRDVLSCPSPESIISTGKCQDLSTRRTKVMESLGLIAPSGSPFQKD
ncbi:PWWP domain containing protein [Quillaja saponaria]|uniref:PWWP domain containing protein n=1 Tax=Quillaja saponaria TaxID=32244 RepID=A0AAD7LX26_QUISA|nr:PWWP domain containing protein [Quillaja saponaria]KAJ7965810.1 PWWP domain containing protein [Quillaja saponaria]